MTEPSLNAYLAERSDDPAIRLLAETTADVRAAPDYLAGAEDRAGGAFLAEEAPAALAADALDRVLARIEAAGAQDGRAAQAAEGGDPITTEIAGLPAPVREAALKALERDRWRLGGPGIRRLPLGLGSTHCELMRIEPGRGASDHDHAGDELTLVLRGSYFDGHASYGPGDVSLAREGFVHAPTANPGEVCYVLAVTFGPPRFKGLIGVVQKLTGFPWAPKPAARG
jgi:putative transcriptional regulator